MMLRILVMLRIVDTGDCLSHVFSDPGGDIFLVFVDEFVDEKYTNSQRKTWDMGYPLVN